MTHRRSEEDRSMRWWWVLLGTAVLAFGIGLLAFTWDRQAAQQLGAALLGGAVIAGAVLVIEAQQAKRHRQEAERRERKERAERVTFTWNAPTPTGNPTEGKWWTSSVTLVNRSGYRVTDVRLKLLPKDWTRQSEPVAPPTTLDRLDPADPPTGLDGARLCRHGQPPEENPPDILGSIEWTDHEDYGWRRWPDDSLEPLGPHPGL
jgi:hypothetical protein